MRIRTKRILDNLYDALAHYKAVYKDKTAQLFDAHGKIRILEAERFDLQQYKDKIKHENDQIRPTIAALHTTIIDLSQQLEGSEQRERQLRADFEASEDAMSTARIDFMERRARLEKSLDQVCERNRWYSDLIHAMTGNRDHETVPVNTFNAVGHIAPDGKIHTKLLATAEAIPGKDCFKTKAFCKCFLSETCTSLNDQCAEGVCKRVEELNRQNATLAGKCKYCRGDLKSDAERIREYCDNCNLPF